MKIANFEHLSPLLFLERSKNAYKNKLAIVNGNVKKTYHEVNNDCLDLVKGFNKIGLKKGDKAAYLCKNNYYLLIAHYAVPMFGSILVPINIRLEECTISKILKHSESKLLVIEEELLRPEYLSVAEKIIVISKGKYKTKNEQLIDYQDLIRTPENIKEPMAKIEVNDENSIITINYTSGTTGQPKGVMYSHRGAYLNALGECLQVGLTNKSNYLWILPMFHCNGWCFTWAVTAVGATHFLINSLSPNNIVESIVKNQITHFCADPSVLIKILEAQNFHLLKNIKDLTIVTAGSSPNKMLINTYERYGISIVHVYGLTETYGPHSICEEQETCKNMSKNDLASFKSLQGIAGVHSTFMKVVDKNMNEVPHNGTTIGEIVMRGNNVMQGYLNDPRGTREVFRDGWFHSGDAAVVHPNGYTEIKDRIKDIIISGGENISSIEIEKVLCDHQQVQASAVIPMHDERWGEVPHAFVELKEDALLTEKEIIEYCKTKLAGYKCPKKITFMTLPRTSTGKIQKYILRNKYYKKELISEIIF